MTPVRILHVVGGMDVGGIQTWLMNVLRHSDPDRHQMDFLVHSDSEFAYGDEIKSRGSDIVVAPPHRSIVDYMYRLRSILADGDYDVVHGHVDYFNGIVLWAAAREQIRSRMAHAHVGLRRHALPRRAYRGLMRRLMRRHSTLRLACSEHAATALFGGRSVTDPNLVIHHYGIDIDLPAGRPSRADRGRELYLPNAAPVMGTAVRFTVEKNLLFWIDIARVISEIDPEVMFVLFGDGAELDAIRRHAAAAGISDRCVFPGVVTEVPELLGNVIDLILLPSRYEGLPILVLEAQAAGIPSLCSDVVTREIDAIPELVERLPLSASPEVWARKAISLLREPRRLKPGDAAARFRDTTFDIDRSTRDLLDIYDRETRRGLRRSRDRDVGL